MWAMDWCPRTVHQYHARCEVISFLSSDLVLFSIWLCLGSIQSFFSGFKYHCLALILSGFMIPRLHEGQISEKFPAWPLAQALHLVIQ